MTQGTTQEKPRRTVEVTVAGHELYNGKPTTKLEIPEWQLQHPITIYGTTPEQQALLPMGATLSVVLQADRLKDGKDDSKPYNYFWSFVGLANGNGAVPEAPPMPKKDTISRAQDNRDRSIQRQVALKAAVDLHIAVNGQGNAIDTSGVVAAAQDLFTWLSEEGNDDN